MKNIKILFIVIIGLLLLASCGNNNLTYTGNNCFVFNKETQTIEQYNFYKEACGSNVVIPEKIDGVDVKAIGSRAFVNSHLRNFDHLLMNIMKLNNCSDKSDCLEFTEKEMQKFWKNYKTIESVIFPKTLSNIEDHSFMGNNLKNISFPDNLLTIDDSAFKFTSLKEVVIPEITKYDKESFNSDVIIKTRKLDSLDMSEIAKKQRDKIRKNDIREISLSLTAHYLDKGTNPNSLDELGEENYIKDIPKEKFLNGKTINGCTFGYRYKKISNDESEIRSCMESEEEFVHNSRS